MTKRKDGRWQAYYTIDGKRYYFYSSEKTEKAAKKDIDRQLIQFSERNKNVPFRRVVEEWEAEKREKIHETTWNKSYRASVDRIRQEFDKPITDIQPHEIDRMLKAMASEGYSKRIVSLQKVIINQIFNFAVIKRYIDYNFVPIIQIPQGLPQEKRSMPTDEELEIVKSNYKGNDLLPYFLLYTGLRISEALALTYDDIDFENKTITVNKKIRHNGNRPELVHETKSKAGTREVILIDKLAEKIPKAKGILFCNSEGEYLTKKQLDLRWNAWKKKHGINVTAHQLRHGFATMLFEAGIPAKDAQELMGHSDIKLTMDIYTDIRKRHKDETRERLNRYDF